MIELQKTRIHDIVHGAFLGLNSLIPNPIKASIRKAVRDHIGGKSSEESVADTSKSAKAVDFDRTNVDIRKQEGKIRKIDEPKFKEVFNSNFDGNSIGNKSFLQEDSNYNSEGSVISNIRNRFKSESKFFL